MTRTLSFVALLIMGFPLMASAVVPRTMSYQGILTDAAGMPVADGEFTLTFTMYDASTDGTPLWTETQQVQVRRGIFSAILGKSTALNLPFDQTYWLGVSVNGGEDLVPRTELVAAPYAMTADDVSGSGRVVRTINTLTDSVLVVGEGGTTVTTRGDTLVISSIIPSGGGGGILGIQDPAGTIAIANPNGPVASVSVANNGIRRQHIGNGQAVKSLNDLADFITLVEGENIDITTITGALEHEIQIDAFSQGGTVGGDLIVQGDLEVQGGSRHAGTEVFDGDIVVASEFGDTLVLNEIGLVVKNAFQESVLSAGAEGIEYRLGPNSKLRLDPFGLALQDSLNNDLWAVDEKGLSYHSKMELFEDTLLLGEGAAIEFPDGSVQTTAATGSSGEFNNVSLVVRDATGDTTFLVEPDGSSYHAGEEQFEGGVILWDPGNSLLDPTPLTVYDASGNPRVGLDAELGVIVANDNPAVEHPAVTGGKGVPEGTAADALKAGTLFQTVLPALDGGNTPPTTGPAQVEGPAIFGFSTRTDGVGIQGTVTNPSNVAPSIWGVNQGGGAGVLGQIDNASSFYPSLWGVNAGTGAALLLDHTGSQGDILIGRSGAQPSPVARIDKTGKGFFNGGTQTGGADIAEAFAVEGFPMGYEPGDVLVISTQRDRTVEHSTEPYSTLVAGVYATKPGVLLSERSIEEGHEDLVPMGVIGVIPTKVTGENGPISRGDLLVTSSRPGHAMKGTDRSKLVGAVLGKALENFDGQGTGVIRVLVNTR